MPQRKSWFKSEWFWSIPWTPLLYRINSLVHLRTRARWLDTRAGGWCGQLWDHAHWSQNIISEYCCNERAAEQSNASMSWTQVVHSKQCFVARREGCAFHLFLLLACWFLACLIFFDGWVQGLRHCGSSHLTAKPVSKRMVQFVSCSISHCFGHPQQARASLWAPSERRTSSLLPYVFDTREALSSIDHSV